MTMPTAQPWLLVSWLIFYSILCYVNQVAFIKPFYCFIAVRNHKTFFPCLAVWSRARIQTEAVLSGGHRTPSLLQGLLTQPMASTEPVGRIISFGRTPDSFPLQGYPTQHMASTDPADRLISLRADTRLSPPTRDSLPNPWQVQTQQTDSFPSSGYQTPFLF
jgi:hypothetical protein